MTLPSFGWTVATFDFAWNRLSDDAQRNPDGRGVPTHRLRCGTTRQRPRSLRRRSPTEPRRSPPSAGFVLSDLHPLPADVVVRSRARSVLLHEVYPVQCVLSIVIALATVGDLRAICRHDEVPAPESLSIFVEVEMHMRPARGDAAQVTTFVATRNVVQITRRDQPVCQIPLDDLAELAGSLRPEGRVGHHPSG